MRAGFLFLVLLVGACRQDPGAPEAPAPAPEANAMNGSLSPAGDRHPGEIIHDDKVDKRVWTKKAAEVPPTIAWVKAGEKWTPVVRIEITGTPERREITKFGPGGVFLETTVQSPRPR